MIIYQAQRYIIIFKSKPTLAQKTIKSKPTFVQNAIKSKPTFVQNAIKSKPTLTQNTIKSKPTIGGGHSNEILHYRGLVTPLPCRGNNITASW